MEKKNQELGLKNEELEMKLAEQRSRLSEIKERYTDVKQQATDMKVSDKQMQLFNRLEQVSLALHNMYANYNLLRKENNRLLSKEKSINRNVRFLTKANEEKIMNNIKQLKMMNQAMELHQMQLNQKRKELTRLNHAQSIRPEQETPNY